MSITRAYGTRAQLLIKKEVTYGTSPGSNFVKMPFITADLGAEQKLIADDTVGRGRDPLQPSRDIIEDLGTIEVPVDVNNIGHWLTGLLGAAVDTGAGPYTHTFTSGAISLPSYSMEVGNPEVPSYRMNLGVIVDSMKLNWQPSGPAKASVSLKGQNESLATSSGGGTPTSLAYSRFSQFQGAISLGGSALANVTAAELTLGNKSEAVKVVRSDGLVAGVDPTMAEAVGKISTVFQDTVMLTDAVNGTAVTLGLSYTIDANDSLVITLPGVLLPRPRASIKGPGGVTADFDFQAFSPGSSTAMATVVLTNGTPTY